ncbi:hypothetical protein CHARACLAT_028108 [Characodon lateralis]|uniref:Uncharacterized protein n=1 Tax=Characodon lateralis TaxID=208331 RepID=A0ABU7EMZ1_9TELE|nr:hypothetical protein [Characodon lateralis]
MLDEERPSSGVHIVPLSCPRPARLGSARFAPSSGQPARIKAESSAPSLCTVTSERINEAQSAFRSAADAAGCANKQLCAAAPTRLHHQQQQPAESCDTVPTSAAGGAVSLPGEISGDVMRHVYTKLLKLVENVQNLTE